MLYRAYNPEAPQKEYRAWLKEKLAWANELPFRGRLHDVLGVCPPVTERLVGDADAVDRFVNTVVVVTRNYRTHYTKKLELRAATGVTAARVTHQLQALVESALLHELGFAGEEVAGRRVFTQQPEIGRTRCVCSSSLNGELT